MIRWIAVLCALVCFGAVPGDAWPAFPEPTAISREARRLVRKRMANHGQRMSDLVWAVILLDYAGTERAADAIAKAPRPLEPNRPELVALAQDFFQYQDLLKERAAILAKAAHERDGFAMGAAYQLVVETCVNCHVTYLNPPPAKRPLQ
jgi:cytochrome c556